jgi:hypothetical protein
MKLSGNKKVMDRLAYSDEIITLQKGKLDRSSLVSNKTGKHIYHHTFFDSICACC